MNLTNRPRRLRNGALLRSMVRETRISADTLIYPMFVQEGGAYSGRDPLHARTVSLESGLRR